MYIVKIVHSYIDIYTYILEVIIKQLDKKEYFMKLSEDFYKSLSHMESYCQFISNQSFDLLQLSIVYIPFIGGVYYILAMFNHIGVLISPDWYTSSFEIINPIKHLISFSWLLPNMTHKEWIELVFVFSRSFIYGYCIYWFYISLYISIKKERELLRKRSIREE